MLRIHYVFSQQGGRIFLCYSLNQQGTPTSYVCRHDTVTCCDKFVHEEGGCFVCYSLYVGDLGGTCDDIKISVNLTLWDTFLLSGGYVLGGAPIYAGQNDAFTTCHRIGIPIFLTAFALVCSVHFNRYTVLRIMQNHYKGLWPPSGLFAEEAMKKLEQYVNKHIEPCIETDEHLNPPWQCWTEAERSRYPGTNPTACEDVSPFGSSPRRSSLGHTAIMQPPAKILREQVEVVTSLGTKRILIIIENEV